MKVEGAGVPPLLQQYLESLKVPDRSVRIEGVVFERTLREQGEVNGAPKTQAQPAKDLVEAEEVALRQLLSAEEQEVLSRLFQAEGPDWGARAYERASRTEGRNELEPPTAGSVDLIG